MLHLVLADAELEPIPDNLRNHKSLRGNAETLLDASDHHSMMVNLYDGRRRGRPDITHLFLLLANESIACCEGMLRAYVHTRHNRVIYVEPETRIIKHYDRIVSNALGIGECRSYKERHCGVPPDGRTHHWQG